MAYVGVGNVARKISKAYVGVGNVARSVKKAYVGIGGVARPCFSSSGVSYFGTITPLSVARYECGAASNGSYALFGSGHTTSYAYSMVVDAYNASLVRQSVDNLSRYYSAAGRLSDNVVFCGGSSSVEAYSGTLSKTVLPQRSAASSVPAIASTSQYAFIGGGMTGSPLTYVGNVDAYTTSYTKIAAPALSTPRAYPMAAASPDYCIFAGGSNSSSTTVTEAYNNSLTKVGVLSITYPEASVYNIAKYFNNAFLFPMNTLNAIECYTNLLTKQTLYGPALFNYCVAACNDTYCMYHSTAYGGATTLIDTSFSFTQQTRPYAVTILNGASAVAIDSYFLIGGYYTTSSDAPMASVHAYITEGEYV